LKSRQAKSGAQNVSHLGILLWHCDAQGASNAFAEMKLLVYCLQTKEADARQQCAQVAQAQGSLRYWQG